jgi:tetratricopeptide (TPR) repeat protein
MNETKPNLHLQIAENGKVLALRGDHKEALRHYKEAMRMCQTVENSEFFLQHYSLCAMESLELMEAHEEIITFCEKSIDFLTPKKAERTDEWFRKNLASLLERKGIQCIYLDEKEEAIEALDSAIKEAGNLSLPLAKELLNWLRRGYAITPQKVRDLQKRHHYFTVRKENVNEKIAVQLPEMINPF